MVQLLLMHNANVNAQDQVAPGVDKSSGPSDETKPLSNQHFFGR